MSCVERSTRPSAYFQTRPLHFTPFTPLSSHLLSFLLHHFLLAYAQAASYCKATAHVRTDDPGSCNTPGGFSLLPRTVHSSLLFSWLREWTPISGWRVYEYQRSPRADPIFSLMTHCPCEQSAPRTWIAYRPRIYDALEPELDDYAYNLCLEYPWTMYYFIRNNRVSKRKNKIFVCIASICI